MTKMMMIIMIIDTVILHEEDAGEKKRSLTSHQRHIHKSTHFCQSYLFDCFSSSHFTRHTISSEKQTSCATTSTTKCSNNNMQSSFLEWSVWWSCLLLLTSSLSLFALSAFQYDNDGDDWESLVISASHTPKYFFISSMQRRSNHNNNRTLLVWKVC